jgi:hypothetical protein
LLSRTLFVPSTLQTLFVPLSLRTLFVPLSLRTLFVPSWSEPVQTKGPL